MTSAAVVEPIVRIRWISERILSEVDGPEWSVVVPQDLGVVKGENTFDLP
jgi:hypothetical protein